MASSVFIATCCCLLPPIRLLTQPQAHQARPSAEGHLSVTQAPGRGTGVVWTREEERAGEAGQGEHMPASKTPHEGRCFIRQGPQIKLQPVSLRTTTRKSGSHQSLAPLVDAELKCLTSMGSSYRSTPRTAGGRSTLLFCIFCPRRPGQRGVRKLKLPGPQADNRCCETHSGAPGWGVTTGSRDGAALWEASLKPGCPHNIAPTTQPPRLGEENRLNKVPM